MRPVLAVSLLLATGVSGIQADEAAPDVIDAIITPADSIYTRPAHIPESPGVLLRRDPLTGRAIPGGAQAWRIQYSSTAPDGSPTVAVATVLAPRHPPASPMPVIAWNHGAVGLVQRCLPSAMPDPWMGMPALEQALAQDWLVVATDYQTDANGVHPFLIGEGEARSTLDAVRALRQMTDLSVDARTVIWGHSQGGHAAIWAGMVAPTYAPDISISGVVAISPATALLSLLDRQRESSVAPILAAFLATAFSSYYPDVDYGAIVAPDALELGRELASRCPGESLDGLAMTLMLGELGDRPLLSLPAPAAFRARLAENEPDGDVAAPVVIAQGLADNVVLPEVTAGFVSARCAEGAAISFWQLPGQDHLSLVQRGSPLEGPLITWTQDRFAGDARASACTNSIIGGTS
ncbi:MAG: lipase family protein [Thermomicrobiales bacterium]